MDNPLIANCPEDPELAAAYTKGVCHALLMVHAHLSMRAQLQHANSLSELQKHVLRLMRDRETRP